MLSLRTNGMKCGNLFNNYVIGSINRSPRHSCFVSREDDLRHYEPTLTLYLPKARETGFTFL